MNRIFHLLPMLSLTMISLNCSAQEPVDVAPLYGVWADADCELVQTGRLTLLFERRGEQINAVLREVKLVDGEPHSVFIAGYVFDTAKEEYATMECPPENADLPLAGHLSQSGQALECTLTAIPRELTLVERIEPTKPYDMPKAHGDNIGECLQMWQLGSTIHSLAPDNTHVEIGTNRHLYCFVANPGMVYCRTANIRHNNNGSLFAQTTRLMANQREFTAAMPEDNLRAVAEDITIDDSLFVPDACSFEQDGIYWSFIACQPDVIVLNGCGETYTYQRPVAGSWQPVEWFAYKPYTEK